MENNSDKIKKPLTRTKPANADFPEVFGKRPPQAVDLEQAVLGAMTG